MDILSQLDPRWASLKLGNSPYTIGQSGCFITEIAEILGITPDVVNQKLLSGGGYTSDGTYLDLVTWTKIAELFPNYSASYQTPYNNDAVLAALQAGNSVIVEVSAAPIGGSGIHAVRYIGNQQCHDPWTGKIRPTSDFPTVYSFVVISGSASSTITPISDPLQQQLQTQIQATNACQSQLKQTQDQVMTLQTQLTSLQEQLKSSQEALTDANTQITSLQTQLSAEQKEIVNLNTQIETQASSNKDYATEIYTLSNDNQNLTKSFNSIVDGLGISRTSKTLDQITKDALSKEDDLDILLKAAGVASGILHNMAKELNLDDPNATDQQIGNKIIQYVKNISFKGLIPGASQGSQQVTSNPIKRFLAWLGLWESR